jgi:hypothetical protein
MMIYHPVNVILSQSISHLLLRERGQVLMAPHNLYDGVFNNQLVNDQGI